MSIDIEYLDIQVHILKYLSGMYGLLGLKQKGYEFMLTLFNRQYLQYRNVIRVGGRGVPSPDHKAESPSRDLTS